MNQALSRDQSKIVDDSDDDCEETQAQQVFQADDKAKKYQTIISADK